MTYAVFDVETTLYKGGTKDASPHIPENFVVLSGVRLNGNAIGQLPVSASGLQTHNIDLLVGHNIGFDLHWAYRYDPTLPAYMGRHMQIWDTQLAEFILSAQSESYPSLDDVAVRRGGSLKDDRIKKMWDAGMDTDEMPVEMLAEYLEGDLVNTELVYLSQLEEATQRGMLPLILTQMEALQATIEMTWNGLAVSPAELEKQYQQLEAAKTPLLQGIDTVMAATGWYGFNPASPKQLSTALYGGTRIVVERQQVGFFKNGKEKFKNVDVEVKVPGFGAKGRNGVTDEEALSSMLAEGELTTAGKNVVSALLELRTTNKQLGTYIKPLLEKNVRGIVYHHLNHCVAVTGRLTSSDPNLQNVTNGDNDGIAVKRAFVSRFGSSGRIVEADFAQLEMIALAYLSGDEQLLDDIRSGRDMHRELYKDMHGRYPTTAERKAFKRLSFGLVYGAGAAKIASGAKIKKSEAERFIETFYTRYPGVQCWHTDTYADIQARATHRGRKDEYGVPIRELVYETVTGRAYLFKEYDAPDWLKQQKRNQMLRSFSPTQAKNYPVQGLATGDIVPLSVGRLYRAVHARPHLAGKVFLVNTVHDSVMLDCHTDVLDEVMSLARDVMRATPAAFEEAFGTEFDLPLEVGVSQGANWLDQIEVNFNLAKEAA